MNFIINNYMNNLTKEKLNNFALKNNILLSPKELNFTFNFIKKNYLDILNNYNNFNIDNYKQYYSNENFNKIKSLIKIYQQKYGHLL